MFARQMVLIGLLHVLNLQSFKQNMKDLITFKYNHWKKYHKSQNLKTSILFYTKSLECSSFLGLRPLGPHQTSWLKLAPPLTSITGSASADCEKRDEKVEENLLNSTN